MSLSREYTEEEYNTLESKAKQFHDALFSEPIDENFIVELLISTTNEERQIIRKFYKDSYNTPVQNDIKLRLQNELKTIAINFFDTPYEYDAKELYKIFSSPKIDDDSIVELFASRPKAHFETVEIAYKKFYNRDLKDDIKNHLPKEHAEFLLAIMENERPIDQTISGNDAYEDASELIKVGLKEYGIDVQKFKKIFINRSREDLILISRAYYEKTQKNLYEAIEEEVEGIIVKPYGIDKLKQISVSRSKEAIKSSCYEYNILYTKKSIQKIVNKLKKNLNLILKNNISETLELMCEGKDLEEIYMDLKDLLIFLFSN